PSHYHYTPILPLPPRPPRPTLFPYTTLFRSHGTVQCNGRGECRAGLLPAACRGIQGAETSMAMGHQWAYAEFVGQGESLAVVGLDRKSTRLNSSHVASSYAVFCLKKKNK